MVDTIDLDVDECLMDVGMRVRLIDIAVRGKPKARRARLSEDFGELDRWIARLIGIEVYPDDFVTVGDRILKRLQC